MMLSTGGGTMAREILFSAITLATFIMSNFLPRVTFLPPLIKVALVLIRPA